MLACAESNFSKFKFVPVYLRENEFLRKTIVYQGTRWFRLMEKNRGKKSRDIAPLSHVSSLYTRLSFFARQKKESQSRFLKAALALWLWPTKKGSGSTLKVAAPGGSGSGTLARIVYTCQCWPGPACGKSLTHIPVTN